MTYATKLARVLSGEERADMTPETITALHAIAKAAREVSRATSGKVDRTALPKPARLALASLDGALEQLARAEKLGKAEAAK